MRTRCRRLRGIAAGGARSDAKEYRRLAPRLDRRESRAQRKIERIERGALLGPIANSIKVDFDKSGWEMYSEIPWAGAHNDGATVGPRGDAASQNVPALDARAHRDVRADGARTPRQESPQRGRNDEGIGAYRLTCSRSRIRRSGTGQTKFGMCSWPPGPDRAPERWAFFAHYLQ